MKLISILLLGLMSFAHNGIDEEQYIDDNRYTDIAKYNPCKTDNVAFGAGEIIKYKLYYNWGFIWISAGEVQFSVKETEDDFIIDAVGNTYASYNWIFSIHDTFTSVINKQTMLPKYSTRNIHEGKYNYYEKVSYDHDLGVVNVESKKRENPVKNSSYEVSNCIQDVLSSIYFLRNTDVPNLIESKNMQFNMFLESKEYNLNLTYKGKSKSKIRKRGKVHSLHLSPQLLTGSVFKPEDEMHMWVSDDLNHLPILIESPIAVGSIKALLISHKGLRHPLNWVK